MQGYDKFFKQARKANASEGPTRIKVNPSAKKSGRKLPASGSAEAQIKKMMTERIQQRRQKAKRAKAPFPKTAAALLVLGFVGGALALIPEVQSWVGDHIEIGFLTEASAAESSKPAEKKDAAKTAAAGKEAPAKAASDATNAQASEMPDTRNWTPEETSFFNKLSERKRELDLKEAELGKLEEELHKQKLELDEKLKQLEQMRGQIAQTLKTRVETDDKKVTKLVEVYSGMKPVQAAKVIETINEDLAVQVLDRMKKKSASDILNVMEAQKAQRLSEMLAGYRKVE